MSEPLRQATKIMVMRHAEKPATDFAPYGVTLEGKTTLTTRDASGNVLSQTTTPYKKSWGLDGGWNGDHSLIGNDYTDLSPAP